MTIVALDERPSWQEVVLSFVPPTKRTAKSATLLARLPMWLILTAQGFLTWRLSDIANSDEALYIDAGHDLFAHLLHGVPYPPYGSYLSGAPAAYPVVASVLDSVGGLEFVRLFSLLCLMVCTVCVQRSTQHLFGRRASLFAALVFATSGSVLFIGKLATFDAPCIALIGLALALAVTQSSVTTGALIGVLLALAATTKYVGIAFAPVVVVLILLCNDARTVRGYVRPFARATTATLVCAGMLLFGYWRWGASIRPGLQFTTTGRRALDYQPFTILVRSVVDDIGLLVVLAAVALVLLAKRRRWKKFLIAGACIGAGALLPVSQIRIHEFTSLDKHTAFSALFLAIPAGLALDYAFTRRGATKVAAAAVIWLLLIDGLWRSQLQYAWPTTLLKALSAVEARPVPGDYISTDGDALRYYSKADPMITWESSSIAYSLFGQTTPLIVTAIRSNHYAGFVYQTGVTTPAVHRSQATVTKTLAHDPFYRLVTTFRVSPYVKGKWYVWQKRDPVSNSATVGSALSSTNSSSG
jgi:hypothetical protein